MMEIGEFADPGTMMARACGFHLAFFEHSGISPRFFRALAVMVLAVMQHADLEIGHPEP